MLKKNVSKTKSNDFYKFTQMIILFQLTLKMTGATANLSATYRMTAFY